MCIAAETATGWGFRRGNLSAVATDLLERIVADADVCFGWPTIRGHRIWVTTILGALAEGWTAEAVLVEFPSLEADDVRACLAYAALLASTRFADLDKR